MKLNVKHTIVKVNEKDLEIEDDKFELSIKVLTYKENLEIMDEFDIKSEKTSEQELMDYAKSIFVNTVISWKGIEDGEGKDLECNNKNKAAIFDFNPAFAEKVISNASKKVTDTKKK